MTCFDIANFPTIKLVKIVSNLLESICIANQGIPCKQLSGFHSRAVPHISIETYITRILKYTPFTNEVLFCIIVVATKSTSDIYYRNSRYAKVGGISIEELFRLEFELLELCDYSIHVPLDELQNYANQLWNLTLQKNDPTLLNLLLPPSPPPPIMMITSPIPTSSSSFKPITSSSPSSSVSTSHLQKSTCSLFPLTPPYENTTASTTPSSSRSKKYIKRSHPYARPPPPSSSSLSY
ncbi:unnamed protein product [Cunninghamella echinulata]